MRMHEMFRTTVSMVYNPYLGGSPSQLHGARRGRLSLLGSDSEEEGVPEAASDSEEERPALLPLNVSSGSIIIY